MRTRILLAVAVVTTTLGVAASPARAQSNEARFCKAVADLSILFNRIDDEPTRQQQRTITRLFRRAQDNAPSSLTEAMTTAAAAAREGDFETPEAGAAIDAIDEWVAGNCDYPVTDVVGRDYSFEGVPDTVKSGVNLFKFTNEGAELHELLVLRIRGDETLDELLALPEDEAQRKVAFMGATFAAQGATTYLYADLARPGRYAAVCFLPVGSTDQAAVETAEGPPHAVEGMATEFTVTRAG
jgi:hypothetical protein